MDEHIRRSYGTDVSDSRLLFGETSAWVRDRRLTLYYNSEFRKMSGCMWDTNVVCFQNRIINLAVGGFMSVLVTVSKLFYIYTSWQEFACKLLWREFWYKYLVYFILYQVTIISSFVFPTPAPNALNVFFGICIIMICSSVLVLVSTDNFSSLIHLHLGLDVKHQLVLKSG